MEVACFLNKPIVSIVGPTATGKSDLAVALAQCIDGEIINSDSMQFYRGMDIGTAKLPVEARQGVPHHLIDILDVTEDADVRSFQIAARSLIVDIRRRGRRPILVGGSGLYARAATDFLTFPPSDPIVRSRIEAEVLSDRSGKYRELQISDPNAAEKIAFSDTRRIVRALEVMEVSGQKFSAQMPDYVDVESTIHIGLATERSILRERIEDRVASMWSRGWVDEVRFLLDRGLASSRTASRAIGYSQIIEFLNGDSTELDAFNSTVVRTRQFARRQETWFRRDPRIAWIDSTIGDLDVVLAGVQRILSESR